MRTSIILIKFNLFSQLWRDSSLEYFQVNIKLIENKYVLKHQPGLKMYGYLLNRKCIKIRGRQVNNQGVMIKVTYLNPAMWTYVLAKTNANLSSVLQGEKNFLRFTGAPDSLFHGKDFFKGIYSYPFPARIWKTRMGQERSHVNLSRIHCTSFIHLFIQPKRIYGVLCRHQKLTNQDFMVISRMYALLFMSFSTLWGSEQNRQLQNCIMHHQVLNVNLAILQVLQMY